MSACAPYFAANGDCRIAAGEALNVEVVMRLTANGANIDLTGRTFALTVYQASTEAEVQSSTATADGDSVSLSFDGESLRTWRDDFGASALRVMLVELLQGSGFSTISDGALNIVRASKTVTPDTSATVSGSIVQTVVVAPSGPLVVIPQGAPGLSFAQQLYPDVIDAPTAEALKAYLVNLETRIAALEAGGGYRGWFLAPNLTDARNLVLFS